MTDNDSQNTDLNNQANGSLFAEPLLEDFSKKFKNIEECFDAITLVFPGLINYVLKNAIEAGSLSEINKAELHGFDYLKTRPAKAAELHAAYTKSLLESETGQLVITTFAPYCRLISSFNIIVVIDTGDLSENKDKNRIHQYTTLDEAFEYILRTYW
jgi:hypothetical protein